MNLKKMMKKLLGRALALTIAFSTFTGTGLEAKASEGITFTSVKDLNLYASNDEDIISHLIYNTAKYHNYLSDSDYEYYQNWITNNFSFETGKQYFFVVSVPYHLLCITWNSSFSRIPYTGSAFYAATKDNPEYAYILTDNTLPSTPSNIELKFRKIDDPSSIADKEELKAMIQGSMPTDPPSQEQIKDKIATSNIYNDRACLIYAYDDNTNEFKCFEKSVTQTTNNTFYNVFNGSYSFSDLMGYYQNQSIKSLYVWDETNSGAGSTPNTETPAPAPAHTHSYSWVTVQEANAGQDGIEEYRCSCGDVQGRNVIPAPAFFVQELYTNITSAPTDGTITFDTGWLYTLSDYLLKMLAERSDVTTVITFEYEHQTYKMTIPAGADYSSLLADTDYFYGYFYFANAVGAVIEAI